LTSRAVAAGTGFSPGVDPSHRPRVLLDAYGWAGSVGEVLAAVRQCALEHAGGLVVLVGLLAAGGIAAVTLTWQLGAPNPLPRPARTGARAGRTLWLPRRRAVG
jgi:hypothetical protein